MPSGQLGDTDASSGALGVYVENSRNLEIKGSRDSLIKGLGNQGIKGLVCSKFVQSRLPPCPTPINQFLFVKGVMISASSGSLGLGAVSMKEKYRKEP